MNYREPSTLELPMQTDDLTDVPTSVHALANRRIVEMRATVSWHDDGRVYVTANAQRETPNESGEYGRSVIASGHLLTAVVTEVYTAWRKFRS
jgi:hypothetical protein